MRTVAVVDNEQLFKTSPGDSRVTRGAHAYCLGNKGNINVFPDALCHQRNQVSILILRLALSRLLSLILILQQVLFVPQQNVLEAPCTIMVGLQANG